MRDARWYVVRSKRYKEEPLTAYVRAQGFGAYLPQFPAHPVNPRARTAKPLFPGYVFVQADLNEVGESALRWMPLSRGLVYLGGEPAWVKQPVLEGIRQRVRALWAADPEPAPRFERGERIWVREGAFEGYEGIFDAALAGGERCRILLQMLNDRLVPLEVKSDAIGPASERSP